MAEIHDNNKDNVSQGVIIGIDRTEIYPRWGADYYGRKLQSKSKWLHDDLAAKAVKWIGNRATGRGLCGGNEILVTDSYIADALLIGSLQGRHFDHYNPRQNKRTRGLDRSLETNDDWIYIFESKVSRADFLNHFNKNKPSNRTNPEGSLHWIVTPKNLVTVDEVPEFWGLFEARGNGLTERKRPILQGITDEQYLKITHNILWNSSIQKYRDIKICPDCGADSE